MLPAKRHQDLKKEDDPVVRTQAQPPALPRTSRVTLGMLFCPSMLLQNGDNITSLAYR